MIVLADVSEVLRGHEVRGQYKHEKKQLTICMKGAYNGSERRSRTEPESVAVAPAGAPAF